MACLAHALTGPDCAVQDKQQQHRLQKERRTFVLPRRDALLSLLRQEVPEEGAAHQPRLLAETASHRCCGPPVPHTPVGPQEACDQSRLWKVCVIQEP